MDYFSKNILFPLFFAAFFVQNAAAQCPNGIGDYFFYAQKLVDQFAIEYPNCKTAPGNVAIGNPGAGSDPVTDLHGLAGLDSILGDLTFYNSGLVSLHGLDSLRVIGGNLNFDGLAALGSFSGLGNLRQIGKNLQTGNTPLPKNLAGFDKLERVGGDLEVNGQGLESLAGLENLRFVGQAFKLEGTQIQNLKGLDKLDTVGYRLQLSNMARLKSLAGAESLMHGSIGIGNCDSLPNLQGLNGLNSGLEIVIYENARLESLDGLENFTSFNYPNWPWSALYLIDNPVLHDLSALDHALDLNSLYIENNPALAICNVQAICDHLAAPGDTTSIFGNLPGCNSAGEILAGCSVAAEGLIKKEGFEIFPNPISDGQPLQILLENDFLGKVKIEIFTPDGRIFSFFEKEKTARRQVFEIENLPKRTSFFVRISDEKSTATRLVSKF